jgi:hypothetical protein
MALVSPGWVYAHANAGMVLGGTYGLVSCLDTVLHDNNIVTQLLLGPLWIMMGTVSMGAFGWISGAVFGMGGPFSYIIVALGIAVKQTFPRR